MSKPLDGVKIADFSHVMAGPFASHLLCLMGAEVIKIEKPGIGDVMRNYGADRRYDGMAPAFIGVNAGKKSIALDLKNTDDLQTAKDLITHCDVVLENFRPGVMAKLGLDYEQIKTLNDQIIYCSVSGYGQSGPMRDWAAIDNIVQATSGMMSLNGKKDDPPQRVGFPIVDTLTGQTAALAIVSALLRRSRGEGGDYIDVAMLDASIGFMTSAFSPFLVTGKPLPRTGNTGYSGQPTSAHFVAKDGELLSLGVVQQHQFEKLARAMGREDWLSDVRFKTLDDRRLNANPLRAELCAEVLKRDAALWEQDLNAIGLPAGVVRDVKAASNFEHLKQRQLILPLQVDGLPDRENVHIVNAGFCMEQDGPFTDQAPPKLGEHQQEILDWLASKT